MRTKSSNPRKDHRRHVLVISTINESEIASETQGAHPEQRVQMAPTSQSRKKFMFQLFQFKYLPIVYAIIKNERRSSNYLHKQRDNNVHVVC